MKKSGIVVISIIAVLVCIVLVVFCLQNKKEPTDTDTDNYLLNSGDTEMELYNPILDNLKNLITLGDVIVSGEKYSSKQEAYQDNNFSYMYAYQDDKNLDIFNYAIIDINNDGQKELLLYVNDENYSDEIFDLYTIVNNEVVHVLSSQPRDLYYLCDNNVIKEEGSNSAFESLFNYYELQSDGKLKLIEGVSSSSLPDSGSYSMSYTYTNGSGETKNISEEESEELNSKCKKISVEKEFLFGTEE